MDNKKIAEVIRAEMGTNANLAALAEKLDPRPKYGEAGRVYMLSRSVPKVSTGCGFIYFDGSTTVAPMSKEELADLVEIGNRVAHMDSGEIFNFANTLSNVLAHKVKAEEVIDFLTSVTAAPDRMAIGEIVWTWLKRKFTEPKN